MSAEDAAATERLILQEALRASLEDSAAPPPAAAAAAAGRVPAAPAQAEAPAPAAGSHIRATYVDATLERRESVGRALRRARGDALRPGLAVPWRPWAGMEPVNDLVVAPPSLRATRGQLPRTALLDLTPGNRALWVAVASLKRKIR